MLRHTLPALLAFTLALSACKKDNGDSAPVNEEEVITTVTVSLTDTGVSGDPATRTFTWNDPDGDGGTAPTVDTIKLNAGQTALARLGVRDESSTPAEDITTEIRNEQNVHQFFFHPSASTLTVAYDPTDYDSNTPPKPVGLRSYWKAATAGSGTVTIVLKHQPDVKPTINNTTGDESLGETDVQVTFPYRIR